ncbi:TPA: hypothetical protein ACF34O_003659, partial [Acinetobacter baumannii]
CIDLMSSVWICKLFHRYSKMSVMKLTYQPLNFTTEIYGNGHNESFYQSGFKYMSYKNRI